MKMTKEEAIAILQAEYDYCKSGYDLKADPEEECLETTKYLQALHVAISALRPITREQVEKVWGVGAWEMVADEGFVDTMGRQVFHLHCPVCDFFWRETGHKKYFRFCPACGAPMTDEAVDMVMERLEGMDNGTVPCDNA